MAQNFTIFGITADRMAVELNDYPTLEECKQFVKGYTRNGNWGGYVALHVDFPGGKFTQVFEPEATV